MTTKDRTEILEMLANIKANIDRAEVRYSWTESGREHYEVWIKPKEVEESSERS